MTLLPTVDYRGVRFTADRVALLDRDQEVVTIPLDNIRALTLRRGFTAERPLPEALLGIACCVLATLGLRSVVWWFVRGGTLWDIQVLLILLLPLGVSLLRQTVRRGFYLLVEMNRGARKFPFVGGLDQHFPDFMHRAEALSRKTIDWRESPWLYPTRTNQRMGLKPKYKRLLERHRREARKYWDTLMGPTLQRRVPAHLLCIFNAPTESTSQTLAARLRASGCESLQFVTRTRWPRGTSWSLAAEDVNPPPLTIDAVTGWIERMVTLGAELDAEFSDWAPIEAESWGKWRISDPAQARRQPQAFNLPPPIA